MKVRQPYSLFQALSTGLIAALLLALAPSAFAQDSCSNRGKLDVMYCDEDGDLVADRPANPAQWVNPDTLIFAYTPVEDPAIYADIWEPFLNHLREVTGKNVRFFAVQSNSAQVEAMRSGRLHIAGFSTGPTPFAVNLAGAVPFALMGSDAGQFGYTLQVYTRVNSGINTMEDLKGKRVAHTSPTSNSGHQAPEALFPQLGIVPGVDYEITFSGSHDNSMLGVVAGDYDAAPVASEVVERMAARGLYDPNEVKIIYETDSFPTTSYNYVYNLHPDLVEKIKEAFFTFDFAGTALGDEFEGVDKFIPINYLEHWNVIRTIQEFNGVEYTEAGL
jgi:phosphonate transport system substrate-binding protein